MGTLGTLNKLDEEVVDLISNGDEVVREIEAADVFNESISNKLVVQYRPPPQEQ